MRRADRLFSIIQILRRRRLATAAAARNVFWSPSIGSSAKPPASDPTIAPSVFQAYTRAAPAASTWR